MPNIIGSGKIRRILTLEEVMKTPEEIAREIAEKKRAKEENKIDKSKPEIITPVLNTFQEAPTPGWLYVPTINMEFSPELNGLNLNWYDCHKLARENNSLMPSVLETWELFFYAKANQDKPEFKAIYDFFIKKTQRNAWHGEWQDSFFKEKDGKMFMHRFKDLDSQRTPEFHPGIDITGTYLTADGYTKISQKIDLSAEGLLTKEDSRTSYVEGENIHFYFPRPNYVARFYADSDRAGLDCYGDPDFSNPALGVRFARRVAPSVTQ